MRIPFVDGWVDDIRHVWKMWSVYWLAAIAILPDAYNAIASMGWMEQVPDGIKWPIRALAAGGILARLTKQRVKVNPDGP